MINKAMMSPLLEERKEVNLRLNQITEAIRVLQKLCDHDWVPDGHDSHKHHYKCAICEKTESR